MGNVILNIVAAIGAALAAWLAIYYCPPPVSSLLARALHRLTTPLRWLMKPFLRFMDIIDRE